MRSVPIQLQDRIGETIKEDIHVHEEKRLVEKKRKKKIKSGKTLYTIQKTQKKNDEIVIKREEYEAVRRRIKEQYLEKQVLF